VLLKFVRRGFRVERALVFTSDNGGPIKLQESGSNNFPLRGGKYADLEGGVRAAAFVSGGVVPAAYRGGVSDAVVHIADWYVTLATLAGLPFPTDERAAAAGLPPLDSADAWPALFGGAAPYTHAEIPLSSRALLDSTNGLKLVLDTQNPSGWQGVRYPNATSNAHNPNVGLDCSAGCLFNVSADPRETTDLGEAQPAARASMVARLAELSKGFFNNSDVGVDSCPPGVLKDGLPCACWWAKNKRGGVLGPYQEV
jgi:arylsulfatase I/J